MYIEPNSTIKLYKNIPIDSDYKNTIYFENLNQQNLFFHGSTNWLCVPPLTNQSYCRVSRGVLRVQVPISDLLGCNYCSFYNTMFGNKSFYAFVTHVEYINNVTTEVYFEIDELQTYLFDITFKECIVEREHTESDDKFEHVVNEGFTFEKSHLESRRQDTTLLKGGAIVYYNNSTTYPAAGIVDGVPTASAMYGYRVYNTEDIQAFFHIVQELAATIEYIQYCPWRLMSPEDGGTGYVEPITLCDYGYDTGGTPTVWSSQRYTFKPDNLNITSIDGYTPRNNKCFCSQFVDDIITDSAGNEVVLEPERFSSLDNALFYVYGSVNGACSATMVPTAYDGAARNYDYALTISNYPSISWRADAFAEYMANNRLSSQIGAITASIGIAASMFAGGGAGTLATASGVAGGVAGAGFFASAIDKALKPQKTINAISMNLPNLAINNHSFFVEVKTVHSEAIKLIDDYFTRYGYKTLALKVPNFSSRPFWNYIKTVDCKVIGNAPADSQKKICDIFNNGITFWKDYNVVGNYSLDNSPR